MDLSSFTLGSVSASRRFIL